MSFMDPDYREQLATRAKQTSAECEKSGGHPFKDPRDSCPRCGAFNPASRRPFVTLKHGDIRAVHDPTKETLTIERCERDALGEVRWVALEQLVAATERAFIADGVKSPTSHFAFLLMTKGRAP